MSSLIMGGGSELRYLGGKHRIANEVASVISNYSHNQTYFEPFVGGGWILETVSKLNQPDAFGNIPFKKLIASDGNDALIAMYKALQDGWIPPEFVSEEEYHAVKQKGDKTDPLYAFCAFGLSFAGGWWKGYARSQDKTCYAATSKRSLMKQLPYIKNVEFRYGLYDSHKPEGMMIYCDPPYANTTQYGAFKGFDSAKFWQTVREWSANNTVLVSEYVAPDDFECIAECNSRMGMSVATGEREIRVERVFKYKG